MRIVRLLPNPRTWRGRIGIAAFVSAFLVLAGTTAGYAFWQSSLTATSTLSAANLTIAVGNGTAYTFGNEALSSTSSITVQNSTTSPSTKTGAVSVTVSGSGALASKVTRQIWTTTAIANCTNAATVPNGTAAATAWSNSTVLSSNLAPQAYAYYCVRSVIANRESVQISGGTQSFTANVSGTISLANFSGTASSAAVQQTQYIYPTYTPDTAHWFWIRPNFSNPTYNYCLDVSGGGSAAGTIVIAYGCKTGGAINQQWKFTASGTAGYYTITPRNATALRIDNQSSTATNGGMIVDTAGTGTDQQWQLQQISGSLFELVNSYSGMCMTSPSGTDQNNGQILQQPCSGSVYQQFMLSQAFENFTCKTVNNTGSATDAFTWSWTAAATGPYKVTFTRGTTTYSTTTGTATATTTGVSVLYNTIAAYGTGTYNVTFVDANNSLVGYGTAVVGNSITSSSLTCTDPAN